MGKSSSENEESYSSAHLNYDYKSSVQFSHSLMSNSLRPHELQHARPAAIYIFPEFRAARYGHVTEFWPNYMLLKLFYDISRKS